MNIGVMKNLAVDLVILNEKAASYSSELQQMIENLVRVNQETLRQEVHVTDGDIFVLRAERLTDGRSYPSHDGRADHAFSRHGTLAQQMERLEGGSPPAESLPILRQSRAPARIPPSRTVPVSNSLTASAAFPKMGANM